jgi:hypothetical protein
MKALNVYKKKMCPYWHTAHENVAVAIANWQHIQHTTSDPHFYIYNQYSKSNVEYSF